MDILEYFKERKEKLMFGISTFKENTQEALVNIIPTLMICITMIGSIVALIKYIFDGTLKMQINIVSAEGFGGVSNAFTSGTTSVLNQGIVPSILSILALLNAIIMIICFYKTERKSKKTFLTIGLTILGVLILFVGVMNLLSSDLFSLSREVRDFYWSITLNGTPVFSIVGVVLFLLSVVLVIISIKGSSITWMIKDLGMAMILSFIVMPLAITLLENIVPIVVGAIGIAIAALVIFVMIFIGIKALSRGSGGSQTTNYSSVNTRTGSTNVTSTKKTYRGTLKLEYGVKAYKVHGYQHDYIESNNGFASSEFCSLADFRKGLYRIEDSKGNALSEGDIPWKN